MCVINKTRENAPRNAGPSYVVVDLLHALEAAVAGLHGHVFLGLPMPSQEPVQSA